MRDCAVPFLTVPPQLGAAVAKMCTVGTGVSLLEEMVASNRIETLPLLLSEQWRHFRAEVRQTFEEYDQAALRGFPAIEDGTALLVAALTIGESLRTYREGKVVKHFKMSPWTTELSHTTQRGEFHTDLNTEPNPPAITAIQCMEPDPGRPHYGITRIARLSHLLDFVDHDDDERARRFLREDMVTMLNDRSSSCWSGRIAEAGAVRYHPETIRAAARRSGGSLQDLERDIAGVERAAVSVSTAYVLERGEILLLSNLRTLHRRDECSVVFRDYPIEFDSRRVSVLHAARERCGP